MLEDKTVFQNSQNISIYTCQDCGNTFNINVDPDEKIARMKKLQPAIDGGLNIEYRCSKCIRTVFNNHISAGSSGYSGSPNW